MATDQNDTTGLHRAIKYRPDIDGLRAIAVTSVVAYHVGLGLAKGGFVGVDVFFAISGYLIGSLVYKEIRGHSFHISKFYERRAKRILPALFGVLIFCYIAGLLLFSPRELRNFAGEAMATITSSSNILYAWHTPGYFHFNTHLRPLLMTWSLGVEEQFYIVFPLLMLLLSRAKARASFWAIAALGIVSLVASVWGTSHSPTHTFYLLPTRAWELASGVLLAIYEANRAHRTLAQSRPVAHGLSLLGLLCIGAAICFFSDNTPFPGIAALLPVAGAVMLIAARDGIVNRMISWRPIVFIGLISYSWYLWHWPMLVFASICCASGISTRAACAVGLVSFGCAALSYKFIEQPFRKSKTSTRILLLRYAAVAVAMLMPPAVFYLAHGFPQRNPAVEQLESADFNLTLDPCFINEGPEFVHPVLTPPCVPSGQGRAIALVGDSHAGSLAAAMRIQAGTSGYRLMELVKALCPPVEIVATPSAPTGGLSTQCLQFNRERLEYVEHDPQVQAVVLAGEWVLLFQHLEGGPEKAELAVQNNLDPAEQAANWEMIRKELDQTVTHLEQSGKTVYLVQDCPGLPMDIMLLMRTRLIAPRRLLEHLVENPSQRYADDLFQPVDPVADRRARIMVAQVAAAHPQAHLIDLRGALCTQAGCRFADGNNVYYFDDSHLSLLGAQVALSGFNISQAPPTQPLHR